MILAACGWCDIGDAARYVGGTQDVTLLSV